MKKLAAITSGLVLAVSVGLAGAHAPASSRTAASGTPTQGLITATISERTVRFSPALHAGLVRLHIVSTGVSPHSLLLWQLNRGVSFKTFDTVDSSQTGNPFTLARAIGGNGQLSPGKTMDIWIRVAKGRIAIDDTPAGHGPGFHLDLAIQTSAPDLPTPRSLGTLAAVAGNRYRVPPGFGKAGTWEFANNDGEAHDATIVRLAPAKTVADLVRWAKGGRKGQPPIDGLRTALEGGFGALQGHSHAWFTIGHLPAGHYAIACFIPGPNGMPHIAMGMAAPFTIQH